MQFGGFDGEFFNDLNVLEIKCDSQLSNERQFMHMVDSSDNHDIVFRLHGDGPTQEVHGIRSLILYRTAHREMPHMQS